MSDSDGVPLCPPEWERAAEIDAAREAVVEAAREVCKCTASQQDDICALMDALSAYDEAREASDE